MNFKLDFELGFDRRVIFSYPTRGVQLDGLKKRTFIMKETAKIKAQTLGTADYYY